MLRLTELDAPGMLDHVVGSGVERKEIIYRDRDRNDFQNRSE